MTEDAEMSDRAAMKGPATRRRRTTVSVGGGGSGATSVKQANGNKWHDVVEKPPQCPGKAKTDEALRHASSSGKVNRHPGVLGQQQLANTPRRHRSAVEDINERLR